MALSLLNTPLKISPVYNPNWFVYNSTNKFEQNFEYIYDIYTTSLTSPILRVRVPPEPVNQYGVYNPQKVVQAFVNPIFQPNITGCTSQSYVDYTIKVGEAYTYFNTWTTSGLVSIGGIARNVFITSSTNYYQSGDTITITQTGGTGDFSGTFTVLSASSNNFVVNLPLVIGIGSGTSVVSTLSPTLFTGLTTASGYSANNGAIDTIDFITYNPRDFYPRTGATNQFYTDVPSGWKVRSENRAVLGYITEFTGTSTITSGYTGVNRLRVRTTNVSGNGEYIIPLTCSDKVMYVGVGPWNLSNTSGALIVSGTLPIIKTDTLSYTVTLENSNYGGQDLLKPFKFNIYEYCGKWDNFEILFMDRKGAWIPFNFELVQRKNVNGDRGNFKRGLGSLNGNNYTYNSYDRGTTNYRNTISYQYTIISNWLTEEQSLFFEQLLTSPEAYWNYDGNGTFVAISLTQLGEEIKDKKNSRLIQYTLQFTLANNPIVQVGA